MKLPPVYPVRMVYPWGKRKDIHLRFKAVFPEFVKELEAKLVRGHQEYGDSSFDKAPEATLKEIREELIDVCGWSVLLYSRILELEKAFRAGDARLSGDRKAPTK